jgi:hypothetical protein
MVGMYQPERASCCALRDGQALDDAHWRQTLRSDGVVVYEVEVEGVWYDVPPVLVVTAGACGPDPDPRTATMAKLWFTPHRMDDRTVSIDIATFAPRQTRPSSFTGDPEQPKEGPACVSMHLIDTEDAKRGLTRGAAFRANTDRLPECSP